MLQVKILKVKHAEAVEARKLLPYIQRTHVYSPEDAVLEEPVAYQLEDDWEKVLSSVWTEDKFAAATERHFAHSPPNQRKYCVEERLYLFRYKVPLLYLERFSVFGLLS